VSDQIMEERTMDDGSPTQTAAPKVQTFSYKKPDNLRRGKGIVQLAQSDIIRGRVQIVREGGENNLHSHRGMDGFWMVLAGRVKFYGPGDVLIGEFGKHEGILIPRGAEYWFESSGEDDLEILQMAGFEKGVKTERVDAEPLKLEPGSVEITDLQKR
jgi:mannose-6-phosphate isomerase-like protein (cupin superfamily)